MTFQELGNTIHELAKQYLIENYNFSSCSVEGLEYNSTQKRNITFKATIHKKPSGYISYDANSTEELLAVLEIKLKNLNKEQDIQL